jgi:hypothetical protein
VLVLIGIGWLLDVLDVTEFPWDVLLPAGLILIGVVLLLTSRQPSGHGGLVATGIVLAVVLMFGSALDVPIGGGVGERSYRPASATELRSEYRLGIGRMTLDLRELSATELEGAGRTRARVGIGQLVVVVPSGTVVHVEAHASLGNVVVFEQEEGGIDVDLSAGPEPAPGGFELILSVGLGEVEVRG